MCGSPYNGSAFSGGRRPTAATETPEGVALEVHNRVAATGGPDRAPSAATHPYLYPPLPTPTAPTPTATHPYLPPTHRSRIRGGAGRSGRPLEAAKNLGWKTFPATPIPKLLDEQFREIEVEENARREELDSSEASAQRMKGTRSFSG